MSGFNEEQFFEDYIAAKPEKTQHELVARYKTEIGPIGAARLAAYLDESHYYGRGPRVSDESEPEPDERRGLDEVVNEEILRSTDGRKPIERVDFEKLIDQQLSDWQWGWVELIVNQGYGLERSGNMFIITPRRK